MTLALTKARLWGVRPEGPQPGRGIQHIVLDFTAATSDVDLDIGDFDGTFWTAVGSSTIGAAVLEQLQLVEPQIIATLNVESPQFLDRAKVHTVSAADQYALDQADSDIPNITCNASDGESAWTVCVTALLSDGIEPVNKSYST